jgi:hypothetical protein
MSRTRYPEFLLLSGVQLYSSYTLQFKVCIMVFHLESSLLTLNERIDIIKLFVEKVIRATSAVDNNRI